MRAYRRLCVRVPKRHRDKLDGVLSGGVQPVRVVLSALAIYQLHQGKKVSEVAVNLRLNPKTVREIGWRYLDGGLDLALYDRQRPGPAPLLDDSQRQRIIALVCADPPAGYARWTVRLLAEEAVKRKLVPQAGRETIRILLQEHDLQPWREKRWCIAELDDEYIERMEDVLEVYERTLSADEPVVCADEKPVTLHEDVRDPIPMKPGSVARRDNEYERRGTANTFCAIEPKAGQHFTKVTPNRSSPEFANFLQSIANHYPEAQTIHLVMDNLSSHTRKAVVDRFGEEAGQALWDRFTVHYTPVHGSWLNQAELEVGCFQSNARVERGQAVGLSVPELSSAVGLSTSYFSLLFRRQTGVSPGKYLREWRIQRVAELLRTSDVSLSKILTSVGVADRSHFLRQFKLTYGITPIRYRGRARGRPG
jgi:AraC-like DNA-binding protein/transposase